MSKYDPLWKWIQEKDVDSFKLTFAEIEEITGVPVDHSSVLISWKVWKEMACILTHKMKWTKKK